MIIQDEKYYYSVEEIKRYIKSQDSLGDVMYYCNDRYIQAANETIDDPEDSLNYLDE